MKNLLLLSVAVAFNLITFGQCSWSWSGNCDPITSGDISISDNTKGFKLTGTNGISDYVLKFGNAGSVGGSNNVAFTNRNSKGSLLFQTTEYNSGIYQEKTRMIITPTGDIGIGTLSPTTLLHASKSIGNYLVIFENAATDGKGLHIKASSGTNSTLSSNPIFKVSRHSTGSGDLDLFIVDGKTGITKAREIIVDANIWADYVFADNYPMMNLKELEEYINKNKHLPGIPSENEVLEKGINVAEMNNALLQKIEELTLYIIALEKRISHLEK